MAVTPEYRHYNDDLDRRRAEETADPWLAGVPPWVKAIAVVGIPGVIALFLVYQVANQIPKLEERQVTIEKNLDQQRQGLEREAVKMDQMFRTLQRICSNTAKTDEDRQRCFD